MEYFIFLYQAKETMLEKNNRLEEESFKCRRALEENASLQRKVEKLKRVEYLGYSDEILVEEVKMYKVRETLSTSFISLSLI